MPPKKNFSKPHLTIQQQIDKLQSKGIAFCKKENAKHYLSHLNYYRLSAYWKPYISKKRVADNKIYNSLVFLKYMLDIIEPLHDWDFRLKEIIEKYGIDVHFMGFPKDWEKLPVWRRG
jgi:abortive infection bacteriophage resistance protein